MNDVYKKMHYLISEKKNPLLNNALLFKFEMQKSVKIISHRNCQILHLNLANKFSKINT